MHHLESQSICSILSFEGGSGALGFSLISLLSTTTPCANVGTQPSIGDSANNPEFPSMLSPPVPIISPETGGSICGGLVLLPLPPPPALPWPHQHLLSISASFWEGCHRKRVALSQSWLSPGSCRQMSTLPANCKLELILLLAWFLGHRQKGSGTSSAF